MKKLFPVLMVFCLVCSGFGAVAFSNEDKDAVSADIQTIEKTIKMSPIQIESYGSEYHSIHFDGVSNYVMKPGQPMMPKVVDVIELPFGVRCINVDVIPNSIDEVEIEKEIRPAPLRALLLDEVSSQVFKSTKNMDIYSKNKLYPDTWFSYRAGCGLNKEMERVTYVAIHLYPSRYNPVDGKLYVVESADVSITYEQPQQEYNPVEEEYDLVIIAPPRFVIPLNRLVRHKNDHGMKTYLETTRSIYKNYPGVDKPEQIKYFIKDQIETRNITHVLLVGGLKSWFWGRAKDDCNQGSKGWYVPVRYNNLFDDPEHPLGDSIYDPGVITDLYYADIYEEGGNFSTWDPNMDGIFAAMSRPGIENDTGIDMFPDVCVGRLACRNIREVNIMVRKIINYEKQPADPLWFEKMIVVSGDGFLDQEDLDFQWDINGLPDGQYTIYAQSNNPDAEFGPIDSLTVTLDMTRQTVLTFNHDDHLKIDTYPFPPIAEITSPSNGDILGNTDFFYEPTEGEGYCNSFTGWANVEYENGIMHIRGKSYDPQPYGNVTDIHLWIENDGREIVFDDWRYGLEMYYEGEWLTGEKMLRGKGGALYYMPDTFEKDILWSSNGKFTGQDDVIEKLSEGSGFVFFSGHGSPRSWGDHYPGVPGNRQQGSLTGLVTMSYGASLPKFPINLIKNTGKPFIFVVGGCHNSQFNVSYIPSKLDYFLDLYMWTYGGPAPECFSWWLTRLPNRGAIASIGNTGLGYGTLGGDSNIGGLDGGICLEFFRQYGEEGHDILGEAYLHTQTYYASTFDMEEDDHIKSLHQWVLLGDPSLMIGGYS